MKTITLIRHAKSDWSMPVDDKMRNITIEGRLRSEKVSLLFTPYLNENYSIFCSDAVRAQQTCKVFMSVWKKSYSEVKIQPELYTFAESNLTKFIFALNNSISHCIIFGHNNAITDFVTKFGGIFVENVPTSGCVSIQFDSDSWSEITEGKTIVKLFPKDIR